MLPRVGLQYICHRVFRIELAKLWQGKYTKIPQVNFVLIFIFLAIQ
jgi:hypothetical protein